MVDETETNKWRRICGNGDHGYTEVMDVEGGKLSRTYDAHGPAEGRGVQYAICFAPNPPKPIVTNNPTVSLSADDLHALRRG